MTNHNSAKIFLMRKNYIVKPLTIHWNIDCDCSSFSFGTVAEDVVPILLFLCIFKKKNVSPYRSRRWDVHKRKSKWPSESRRR